jgi:hypothetical protein
VAFTASSAEGVLAGVGDVQEAVLVLVLLIDRGHQRGGRRQDLIDEDEDGLLRRELDALADHVDELADGEVGGDQVLLLVDSRDVRLLHLLADDRDAVGVLLPDALGLSLALLERVLILELGAHVGGVVVLMVDEAVGGNL